MSDEVEVQDDQNEEVEDQDNEQNNEGEDEDEEEVVDNDESDEEVIEDNNDNEKEIEKDKIKEKENKPSTNVNTNTKANATNNKQPAQKEQKQKHIPEETEEEEQLQAEGFCSRIKDPNVLKLMKINIESTDKESIINILMKNNALETKNQSEKLYEQSYPKEKAKKKFKNTGTFNKGEEEEIKYAKTDKFHIYKNEDDPQLTSDFQAATQKVISKLVNENNDSEVMKILFADEFMKKRGHSEITRDQITQKVNMALNKKQEELEKLASKWNQDYNEKHTFAPQLVSQPINQNKRNLNQFLEDQKNHNKKVSDKIESLKKKEEEKETQHINKKPIIDKNSQTLFENIVKSEEPVYDRLFNKKYQTAKTTLLKDKKKNKDNENGEKKKKQKPKKIQKKTIQPEQEQGAQKEKEKEKKKKKEKELLPKPLIKANDLTGNDILLKNFLEHYNIATEQFKRQQQHEQQDSNDKPKKIKINLQQIHQLLFSLGMCSMPKADNSYMENQIEESTIQLKEKELIEELWNTLKDADSEVNIEHLKQFLISVVNLHYYYLYKNYIKTHSTEDIKKLIGITDEKANETSNLKEVQIDLILKEVEKELKNKIDQTKPSKYINFDNSGNVLIPLSKSKKIKKDFSLFAITYMSKRHKHHYTKEKEQKEVPTFKPTINNNADKMSSNYRSKLKNTNDSNDKDNEQKQIENIDRIVMKRKKKIAENIKQQEENQKKELEQCTFKPKIINYSITKATGANRFNELFQKGSEKEKNRRDKTSEDFDLEKINECTFSPTIYTKVESDNNHSKTIFSNDIINERNYQTQYERLRNGRMEHLIKEAIHERFALDEVLQDYIKKTKKGGENDDTSNYVTEEKTSQEITEKETENINQNKNEIDNENNNSSSSNANFKDNQITTSQSPDEGVDENGEKKESIPLLIIDVNIRQGVKKKIFVYEGDTPEGLSEKFAAEHNLEPQTKEKLQNLIHNHMLRLLTRIDEENQSISEKSSANQNQQNS